MASSTKISRLRRRILRAAAKCYPLLSGLIWGGFWMPSILGLEDAGIEIALVIAAFAFGTCFRKVPSSIVTKFGAWACSCIAFVMTGSLWPAAFFFGMLELPGKRGKYSGTFFTGFIVGALLGAVFDLSSLILRVSGLFYLFFNHNRRLAVFRRQWVMAALGFLLVATECWFFVYRTPDIPVRSRRGNNSGMAAVTRLSSFGLSEAVKPKVLFISRNVAAPEFDFEYKLMSDSYVASPGKIVRGKYDVVIVEHLSSAMYSAPEKLLETLTPGGILVVPQRFCQKLPALHWRTLPGGGGDNRYAAAVPGSDTPLEITPESIDRNLCTKFVTDDDEETPAVLPGAVAGALTGFESTGVPVAELRTPEISLTRWIWCGVLLIIVLEIFLHKTKVSDWFCTAVSSFVFGALCNILNGVDYNFLCAGWLVFLLIAGAFFIELPFKSVVLRCFSIMSIILLLLWDHYGNWMLALAALLFAGLSFSGAKSRYREKIGRNAAFEFIYVLCFAAGFWVSGMVNDDDSVSIEGGKPGPALIVFRGEVIICEG